MADISDLLASALQSINGGDIAQSVTLLGEAMERDPKSATARHLLGLLASRNGDLVAALGFFNEAHNFAPDILEHAEALAITYAKLGKVADALFFAKMSPALQPSQTPGLLPSWMGQFADHFANIKADPLLQAGLSFQAEGKLADAEAMFRQEITLNPHSTEGWRSLALTLLAQDKPFEAEMAMRGLVATAALDAQDFAMLGQIKTQTGRPAEAMAAFENARRMAPDDPGVAVGGLAGLRFNPAISADTLVAAVQAWVAGRPPAPISDQPFIEPLSGRKLRVGLLSGRIEAGLKATNALSLFLQRGEQVGWELTVLNCTRREDPITRRLRHVAEDWIDLAEIDDATASLMIENVGVDVLVALDDLGNNERPGLLLEHPNCLILAWGEHPAIAAALGADGVIGDATLLAGHAGPLQVTVAGSLYGLPDESLPPLPPRGADEPVVIGLRASRAQLNPTVCAQLAGLLLARPDALLLVDKPRLGGEAGFDDLVEQFVWYGCADRIVSLEDVPPEELVMTFLASLDVLLDLPPVSDVDAAVGALLLGRPVVSWAGDLPSSRSTASVLTGLGLGTWVAHSADQVEMAISAILSDRAGACRQVVDAVAAGDALRPLARAKALEAALRQAVSTIRTA